MLVGCVRHSFSIGSDHELIVRVQTPDCDRVEEKVRTQILQLIVRSLRYRVRAFNDGVLGWKDEGEMASIAGHVEDVDAEILAEDSQHLGLAHQDESAAGRKVCRDPCLALRLGG